MGEHSEAQRKLKIHLKVQNLNNESHNSYVLIVLLYPCLFPLRELCCYCSLTVLC